MRLRQVALVARELERSVEDLCGVLGIEVAYNDPNMVAFGLVNAVMPVGDTFLEVVSPAQEKTTAGRYLERRGGDGGRYLGVESKREAARSLRDAGGLAAGSRSVARAEGRARVG